MNEVLLPFTILFLTIACFAGALSAAPWVVTRRRARMELVGLISPKPGDTVVDLGAGDGSVLMTVADAFPEVKCIGAEIAVLPWLVGKIWLALGGRKYANVRLRLGDLFAQDISEASVVFCFLMPGSYKKLAPKFARELKDDAVAVMEAWPIEGFKPMRTVVVAHSASLHIYEGRQFRQKPA